MPKPLRTQLENTVNAARAMAEKVGKAALTQLAVAEAKAPDYLNESQQVVRRKLRSHARAISAGRLLGQCLLHSRLGLEICSFESHPAPAFGRPRLFLV